LSDFLTFVVAGITVGSVFALVAVGIVLTYRTSGILNFAQGALAIVAVEIYVYFTANLKLSWELSSVLAVIGGGIAMGLILERLARVLTRATPAHQVVATVGLLIAIQAGAILIGPYLPGSHPRFQPPPFSGNTVRIAGVNVGWDQIIIMAGSVGVACVLWAFLSRTVGTGHPATMPLV